jgi:hypothetical protein
MSAKLCFYCKTLIQTVKKMDGVILYASETLKPSSVDGEDSEIYESTRSSIVNETNN